jgi:uncharacterized iron-regulated membrane protein
LRNASPPALIALATVTIAVGWFLPLLGLSLLAFLVVDVAAAAVKRATAKP